MTGDDMAKNTIVPYHLQFLDKLYKCVRNYTVALAHQKSKTLVGTGVLLDCDGKSYILTAGHVVNDLLTSDKAELSAWLNFERPSLRPRNPHDPWPSVSLPLTAATTDQHPFTFKLHGPESNDFGVIALQPDSKVQLEEQGNKVFLTPHLLLGAESEPKLESLIGKFFLFGFPSELCVAVSASDAALMGLRPLGAEMQNVHVACKTLHINANLPTDWRQVREGPGFDLKSLHGCSGGGYWFYEGAWPDPEDSSGWQELIACKTPPRIKLLGIHDGRALTPGYSQASVTGQTGETVGSSSVGAPQITTGLGGYPLMGIMVDEHLRACRAITGAV